MENEKDKYTDDDLEADFEKEERKVIEEKNAAEVIEADNTDVDKELSKDFEQVNVEDVWAEFQKPDSDLYAPPIIDVPDLEFPEPKGPRTINFEPAAFQMLKSVREKQGFTQEQLTDELRNNYGVKVTQAAISKIEKGLFWPRDEILDSLSKIYKFETSTMLMDYLLSKWNRQPAQYKKKVRTIALAGTGALEAQNLRDRIEAIEKENEVRRIRLFKTRTDITGCELLDYGTRIAKDNEYITAPPIIRDNDRAYSVEIIDNSMAPRYMRGDIVFVDPSRPVVPGDDVILVLKYPEEDNCVAVCRTLTKVHVDEDGGDYAAFELVAQETYQTAIVQAERTFVMNEVQLGRSDEEVFDLYEQEVEQYTLTVGLNSDFTVGHLSHLTPRKMILGPNGYHTGDPMPETGSIHKVVCSYRKGISPNSRDIPDEYNVYQDYSGMKAYL